MEELAEFWNLAAWWGPLVALGVIAGAIAWRVRSRASNASIGMAYPPPPEIDVTYIDSSHIGGPTVAGSVDRVPRRDAGLSARRRDSGSGRR
jgi:hypothetical protein